MRKILWLLCLSSGIWSCNEDIERHPKNDEGSYERVSRVMVMGTVAISTEGASGVGNENKIARQLRKAALKLYPESTGITNIRIDGTQAFADVIR
ncbi:hypothetical protein [Taibaiella sp. KBW10]|uniref:hypothetical protein n=1 Tax=Taibaiella sp. KBW10 TaxID=2153357 RepID=UPI000F5A7080|nr:hypothetical protein [Taibaiella sp. KBW10]